MKTKTVKISSLPTTPLRRKSKYDYIRQSLLTLPKGEALVVQGDRSKQSALHIGAVGQWFRRQGNRVHTRRIDEHSFAAWLEVVS